MQSDDPRQSLLALLTGYAQRYSAEAAHVERYTTFVKTYADCFERSQLLGHVTGSAFIVDASGSRVLLTHHRKLNRWLQPGGHADGVTDVHRVAMTEAEEESGLVSITFVTRDLLDVDIHAIPARPDEPEHFHYDCRFLLQAGTDDEFVVSDESHDLAWVALGDLESYTDEASILRMREKAAVYLS